MSIDIHIFTKQKGTVKKKFKFNFYHPDAQRASMNWIRGNIKVVYSKKSKAIHIHTAKFYNEGTVNIFTDWQK